jgi:ABC-type lipoprotein release transport system permease subunit
MHLGRLILRELWYRKLNFLLGTLSVLVAVGCLIAALALLREHQLRTEEIVAEKEAETQRKLAAYEDDVRKITVRMGFNILILPKDQNLGDLYAADYAEKTMPEEYAERLARSGVATLNHILPSLQQKVKWPETERTVIVMGVRGEVMRSQAQKPILSTVKPGEAVLGYELHRGLSLRPGARIKLLGREFAVSECRPERGTKDDITVWLNLADAQALLGKPGQINAILALECNCESVDRLGEVREEVAQILPDTQVIEYATQALARAEARNRAAKEAQEAIEREQESRARLGREKEALAAVIVPLVLVACAAWVGFVAWNNVRERRVEIGILRALGLRSRQILCLFLGRALLMGLAGAGLGYAAGLLFALAWNGVPTMHAAVSAMLAPAWIAGACVAAPLLAAGASWLPALLAARQDPAAILREG